MFSLPCLSANIAFSSTPILIVSLLACTTATALLRRSTHELLVGALSWTLVWIYAALRSKGASLEGRRASADRFLRRQLSWHAGGLLLLANICERAGRGSGGTGSWWTKAFLPLAIYLFRHLNSSNDNISQTSRPGGYKLLISSWVSFLILVQPFVTPPSIALGVCNIVVTARAYYLMEEALTNTHDDRFDLSPATVSANGTITRASAPLSVPSHVFMIFMRDLAAVLAAGSIAAALIFEPLRMDGLSFHTSVVHYTGPDWQRDYRRLDTLRALLVGVIGSLKGVLLLGLIRKEGALRFAFIDVGGALCGSVISALTTIKAFLTLLWAATTILFFTGTSSSFSPLSCGVSDTMKTKTIRRLILWAGSLTFIGVTALFLHQPHTRGTNPKAILSGWKPAESPEIHPINWLIKNADEEFDHLKSKQSKSLAEAVTEYRNRYKIPPPPNFDKWYEFAKNKGVQLIDEYDTIHHSLLPFWGLPPSTIRARAREALGYRESDEFHNFLIGLLIRDGQAVTIDGGAEWQQQATIGMIKDFVQYLPDMDIAFNTHDEPRVVVPEGDLARLVSTAKSTAMPEALAFKDPRNSFSHRPKDMNDGKSFERVKITKFNRFAHQPVWTHSTLSCSPLSPARELDGTISHDNYTAYATGLLGFVQNQTAFSDICNSPSLEQTFGFFDRPNAFDVVHSLYPIFSQSKISSFQDILYPSPWYWFGKVPYNETKDMDWDKKDTKMYWRGSTTGGFSRHGGWKRQHRQRFVTRINANDDGKIMENTSKKPPETWKVKEVHRQDFKDLFDVKFSHIGQCDPEDCEDQKKFFGLAEKAEQQDAWKFQHLLDIDGNAFSGRFYAFLKSRSLVYKMAIFREWHMDWLKPWVHYVPLSLKGDEWLESVRYFAKDDEGKNSAIRLAMQGRAWAEKALRNEDFEVWFFRLLLEYGRLIDDDREKVGYSGP